MVKKIFAYMMLVLITATSLQQLSILSMYWLTQDYITEKFCVNKDKPELQCNGKCHMKDMVAENTEKENQTMSHVENILPVFYTELCVDLPTPLLLQTITLKLGDVYLSDAYFDRTFQPPEFLV
jgi:hypothetical protein